MSENVQNLKAGYEAFARGDLDAAMRDFDDDIRWENPNAQALPNPGVFEGKDQVREVLAQTPQFWEDFSVSPDEFIDGGDTVVALGHLEGRGRESGREVKVPFVHVWRMSGGKARRVQLLFDTALVIEALGR